MKDKKILLALLQDTFEDMLWVGGLILLTKIFQLSFGFYSEIATFVAVILVMCVHKFIINQIKFIHKINLILDNHKFTRIGKYAVSSANVVIIICIVLGANKLIEMIYGYDYSSAAEFSFLGLIGGFLTCLYVYYVINRFITARKMAQLVQNGRLPDETDREIAEAQSSRV